MKLLCLDGNSIANRAFYGIKVLTTKDGRFTNAIFGFMNIFLKLLADEKPDAVAIAFDLRAPTFRHKEYDGYKATRKGMPPELAEQMPVLKELLTALGYVNVSCEGYEADDILGTLARSSRENGCQCVIATGDRDSLQLAEGDTRVLLTTTKFGRGEVTVMDENAIKELYGVEPRQLIDVKALMGDKSDNIPGVAGVGEKTALELIKKYGTLDGVYGHTEEIKGALHDRLLADRESAYMSRFLAEINTEAPVERDPKNYARREPDAEKAAGLFASLEMFKTLARFELEKEPARSEEPQAEKLEALSFDLSAAEAAGRVDILYGEECCAVYGNLPHVLSADELSVLLESGVQKRAYDSKDLFAFALEKGIQVKNIVFDLKLAAYLLNPSSNDYSLSRLSEEYNTAPEFSCGQAGSLSPLCDETEKRLAELKMTKLLTDIELPLARVLAEMEQYGFAVDKQGLTQYGAEVKEHIDELTQRIYTLAGEQFNLNSPKQLGEILFERLGLPTFKKTKSGYSTNAETLEKLKDKHEIVPAILDYRIYQKLYSTYVEGLIKCIGADGRIHTRFNQTETRTGRISSNEPNLQNIPVRTELGSRLRKYFIAPEGYRLADADYSQIELRVLAHISGDERMREVFAEGRDIHAETAAQVFGVSQDEVTGEMRRRAKAVNFGIVYGIGAFSLSENIGVTYFEADRYIKKYLERFDGVDAYMKQTVKRACDDGYVTTMFERRRYLPELRSGNRAVRQLGERMAMNTPIQGSAADIIKIAMIRVSDRLKKEGMRARLILQVHDELIIETPEDEAQRAAALLKEEMESAVRLDVPLVADANVTGNWLEAK